MKLKLFTLAAAILTATVAFAQPNSNLRPNETVLLYADSFEGNVDPVYGEKISYAGFTMEKENGLLYPDCFVATVVYSDAGWKVTKSMFLQVIVCK